MNTLYYGDNLDILKRYVKDESVDLVYLDPPFNSNVNYNVLFAEKNGSGATAQIKAFADTWHWDQSAALSYRETVEKGGNISIVLQALRTFLGENDMMAYLAMMTPRLMELHRVLKSTGSLYLHCDATASHYLKIILDAIFSINNFTNEIIWKRQFAHGDSKQGAKHFGRVTDTILFYVKSEEATWNPPYMPYSDEAIKRDYKYFEAGTKRQYRLAPVDGPGGASKGNPHYEFLGVMGYWRFSKEKMQELFDKGRIVKSSTGKSLSQIMYLDEGKGRPIDNFWDDIFRISPTSKERLGYPTQKPEALLERIINASSKPGDIVLDPFCGCGTAIAVAEKLNRQWIGIDITHLAITLMKHRLRDSFEKNIEYKVIGEPADLSGAQELAQSDPYQFQWWALGLVGARPVEQKKGADKGIDGRLFFHDDESGKTKQMIFSVKAGQVHSSHIRDLNGVLEREKAVMGVLISMEEPTRNMVKEASASDLYEAEALGKKFPKIQIITVGELLKGKKIEMPYHAPATFKKAEKFTKKDSEQSSLFDKDEE